MEKPAVAFKTVLITGQPGVGKTTLVRKVCEELRGHNQVHLVGFYTEELRSKTGERMGFDVVTFNGIKCKLAREKWIDDPDMPRVGKYSVFLDEFEEHVMPLLKTAVGSEMNRKTNSLLVIDEIGKMELLSKQFEEVLTTSMGQRPLLATIPLRTSNPIPIVEAYKNQPSTKIFHITKTNRNNIVPDVVRCILDMMVFKPKKRH